MSFGKVEVFKLFKTNLNIFQLKNFSKLLLLLTLSLVKQNMLKPKKNLLLHHVIPWSVITFFLSFWS